jgi:exosortase
MTSDTRPSAWWTPALLWVQRNPLQAFLAAAIAATIVYFFGFQKIFTNGQLSTFVWAWEAWNPESNHEHSKLVIPIAAFLVWHARDKLKAAPIGKSRWGWLFIGIGLFLFVAGARTLQARLSLLALPFLLFGIILYVFGRAIARILLFPVAFLLFLLPLDFLTQATMKLQFIETNVAAAVCNFFGLGVYTIGTVVHAASGAFQFEVDEGCSGIRSLMAIAMLSAIYAHLTQDRLWKKLSIFGAALLFAIIGNAGRLVSIFVVARIFGQEVAGGIYHTMSGFLSFPFAIGAMLLFSKVINFQPREVTRAAVVREKVSYDY